MADNVYAALLQAWSVAKTSGANTYGVEIAIVTNVQDPDKQGRVKICFPRLPGKPESDWARVCQPAAGGGRGFYWLPEVNDEVLVAFERGQTNRPYVIGALWNGKDKPMKNAYTDDNTKRMIQTKSGHQILFDDKSGHEKISIGDKSGKRTLTFDVKDKKFLVEAKEGDVEIHAKKKLVLVCEDLEVKTRKTGKIQIGSKFDLKVADKASFKAGPKMELKASKVNLNPPSLSVAAVAAAARAAAAAAANAAAAAAAARQNPNAAGTPGAAGAPGGGVVPTKTVAKGAAAGPPGKTGGAAQPGAQNKGAAAPAGTAWTKAPAGGAAAGTGAAATGTATATGTAAGPAAGTPRIRRARLKGLHFETGKTFLLPSAMNGMRQLVKLYQSFNGLAVLVNGHTDKQGPGGTDGSQDPGAVEFNRGLSEERAEAIKAFLLDDAGAWMQWYAGKPTSRPWGVREDQFMLATLRDGEGAPFYGRAPDGEAGRFTREAVLRFQRSVQGDRAARGLSPLAEDGVAGDDTRRELIRGYLALEGTSLEAGATVDVHGCGMSHPLPETAADPNPDQPLNRRVEVFLFEGRIDPRPPSPCPGGGCAEYQKWVDQKIADVDLDDGAGSAAVAEGSVATFTLVDWDGAPLSGATAVLLIGDDHREALANADGVVKIELGSGEEVQLVEVRAPGPLHVVSTEKA